MASQLTMLIMIRPKASGTRETPRIAIAKAPLIKELVSILLIPYKTPMRPRIATPVLSIAPAFTLVINSIPTARGINDAPTRARDIADFISFEESTLDSN